MDQHVNRWPENNEAFRTVLALRRRAELSGRSVLRPFSRPIGNPPAVLPAAQDNNPASGSLSVSASIGATIKKQCHQSALCPVPISAIVPSLGPGAPSDWQSPRPIEKAATLVDGYDISTSVWENEMGREIGGSDASKTDHRCPLRSPT
jgi:hypothetical protein